MCCIMWLCIAWLWCHLQSLCLAVCDFFGNVFVMAFFYVITRIVCCRSFRQCSVYSQWRRPTECFSSWVRAASTAVQCSACRLQMPRCSPETTPARRPVHSVQPLLKTPSLHSSCHSPTHNPFLSEFSVLHSSNWDVFWLCSSFSNLVVQCYVSSSFVFFARPDIKYVLV